MSILASVSSGEEPFSLCIFLPDQRLDTLPEEPYPLGLFLRGETFGLDSSEVDVSGRYVPGLRRRTWVKITIKQLNT
jgi:hypothetical protein